MEHHTFNEVTQMWNFRNSRKRGELTTAQDLTDGGPPQSFPTMLLRGMDRLLAPHHPFHMAGQPEWQNKREVCS